MVTKFKIFENKDIMNNIVYLLCITDTNPQFYYKFTKGKKYKLYLSSYGYRLKDDNGNFWRIFVNENELSNSIINNDIYIFESSKVIFTTAKSIEDYYTYLDSKKYNL